ncbi:lipopolysaccharide assembly protein LapA domain-containing protein [Kingella negevensis]|uniref:Lipopolysaccharide assembly protein A domain-containing protein n=1 Tax=Kingella negevensis TaxID=1522312 RepID=A0A238T9C6_9NEIS|nr:lipopolysaccharide assembly protein LapA domain-containing protein [Kingella negevensis]MDK4684597.1 lipopolysaccharide assembly protein LapA domain-containing protein [Kingella negevensis]MDK4696258.1 lipopolysaccharide assembly protein LapA domain-containing protein [Kingella negevensis]MDK4707727.1 lipopolysaccharide assembly protein LapA domain-containing protein [Kingella negevensis]MDK4709837.1 lipopolysaccharide assembly protein LapA domain-containing protein [Kingella negevensis]WII
MKLFANIIKFIILIIFVIFALINTDKVPFSYLPSQKIDIPLIVVLFSFFVLGAIVGVFSMFGRLLRLRNQNARLRSEVQKSARLATQDIAAPAPAKTESK